MGFAFIAPDASGWTSRFGAMDSFTRGFRGNGCDWEKFGAGSEKAADRRQGPFCTSDRQARADTRLVESESCNDSVLPASTPMTKIRQLLRSHLVQSTPRSRQLRLRHFPRLLTKRQYLTLDFLVF